MKRIDFLKLAKAIKKLGKHMGKEKDIDDVLDLLREIFNANGGAERYLFRED